MGPDNDTMDRARVGMKVISRTNRVLIRWMKEALQLWAEHECIQPVHYWLHQTKGHYRRGQADPPKEATDG